MQMEKRLAGDMGVEVMLGGILGAGLAGVVSHVFR